jgi:autotransporter-associated beta strand protein
MVATFSGAKRGPRARAALLAHLLTSTALVGVAMPSVSLAQTVLNVTVAADSGTAPSGATGGAGSLSDALAQVNASTPAGGWIINLQTNVTLAGPLSPIFNSVTINGNGFTVSGNNTTRIFMVGVDTATQTTPQGSPANTTSIIAQRPRVAINNITLANGLAQGGTGGAGGMGAGGALFVNQSADVTLSNVSFAQNRASGGSGSGSGGGGGLGGEGDDGGGGIFGSGGGGGGGIFGNSSIGSGGGGGGYSGSAPHNLGPGTAGTLSIAGLSGSGGRCAGVFCTPPPPGGANGGSGASAGSTGGGGGGFGGGNAPSQGTGGNGGFGGGGGATNGNGGFGGGGATGFGGNVSKGGNGGFGGGGGVGSPGGNGGFGGGGGGGTTTAGNGGFGGGGGRGTTTAGSGGFGGGGGNTTDGGGGAAMGGAVFVVKGGNLTVNTDGTASSASGANAVVGGTGANAGQAFGSGFFVQGSTLTFGGTGSYTISNDIADLNGSAGNTTTNDGLGGTGGATSIVKNGAGTLVLSGSNTFTGGITVAAGTLSLGSNSAAGTGTITTTGSVIDYADGVDITNPINLNSDTTKLQVLTGASATQSGAIGETGSRPLEKIGAGELILSGTNTYTGPTTISAGALTVQGGFAISNSSAVVLASGATFNVATGETIGSLGGTGGTAAVANNQVLTTGGDDTSTSFAGTFSGQGHIVLTGSGTKTLTGTGSSIDGTLFNNTGTTVLDGGSFTVAGVTEITTGTFNVINGAVAISTNNVGVVIGNGAGNNATALVSGTGSSWTATIASFQIGVLGGTGTLTVADGAALNSANLPIAVGAGSTLNIGNGATAGTIDTPQITLNGPNARIVADFTDTMTLAADIVDGGSGADGSLTKNGEGKLILTSSLNSWVGGTTVNAGTLQIGNGGTTGGIAGDIALNNAAILAFNRTSAGGGSALQIDGGISGTGSVQQNGDGTTILTAFNSYQGATTINAGTLALQDNGMIGGTSGLMINNTGTFDISLQNDGSTGPSIKNLSGGADTIIALGNRTLSVTSASGGEFAGTIRDEGLNSDPGAVGGRFALTGGTLKLSGANTYTGGTTIGQFGGATATLIVTNDNAVGTGTVNIDGTGVFKAGLADLTFANDFRLAANGGNPGGSTIDTGVHTMTISGVVANSSDPARLVKDGAGTLILTNDNSYSNGTVVNAGRLQLGDININDGTTGAISTLGNIDLVSSTSVLAFNRSDPFSFGSVIIGTGSVEQLGSGTTTLTQANSYSGGTKFNAGAIAVSADNNLGNANGGLTFDGGTLQFNASFNLANTRAITLNAGGGRFNTNGFNSTIAQAIDGVGSLTKAGTGTLNLAGASTYTGATDVNAGTLRTMVVNALSNQTALTVAAGATFSLNGLDQRVGSLAGAGLVNLGTGNLTTGGNDAPTLFSGLIQGGGGLVKTGAGILTLSGNNTFSGGVTVAAGTLSLGHANAAGTGTITTTGSVIDYALNNMVVGNPILLSSNTTQLQVAVSLTATQQGVISQDNQSRPLEKIGAGTLILTANNTYTGVTTITAGTLQIGNGGATGTLGSGNVVNNAALVVNRFDDLPMAQNISGTGTLTKTGAGNLTLSGNNTYSGGTTVTQGTLQIGDATLTGTIRGAVTVNNATLDFVNADTSFITSIANTAGSAVSTINFRNASNAGSMTITSEGVAFPSLNAGVVQFHDSSSAGASTITVNGYAGLYFNNNSRAGTATIVVNSDTGGQELEFRNNSSAESANITINTGGRSSFLGSSTAANATITNNRSLRFDDTATAGNSSITNNAGAGLVFSGQSTAGASTIINNGGLAFFQTASGGTAAVTNNAGGSVNLSSLTSAGTTLGSLDGAGNVVLGSKNLTVGSNNLSTEVSGVIFGNNGGSLTKVGTGTLTLSGSNTYTGGTTINAGTLEMRNGRALADTGTVTIADAAGATLLVTNSETIGSLAGGGATGGAVQIAAGQTLTTGNVSDTTFAGAITGGGALTKQGAGIFTLSGNNTYSGGTILAQGTFSLQHDNALGTGGLITQGSVVDYRNGISIANSILLNSNDTQLQVLTGTATQAGAITETGGARPLQIIGAGTLIFTADNAYTGLTTIADGILQFGNGGTTGGIGSGPILNNAILAVNRSNNFAIDGAISGTGMFQQNGTGATFLTATSSYTGATTVNAGALVVTGDISTSSQLRVNAGASLFGTGTVGSTNIDGGILSPGLSIGTITIKGSLVMSSAAAYIVEVNPTAADRTNVTGTASLGGALQLLIAAGTYTVNQQYVLLRADGGRSGEFTSGDIQSLFGSAIRARIDYTTTDVILNLAPNSISPFVPADAPQNAGNIAGAIDQIFQGGNPPAGFLGLFNLTQSGLVNALQQLSGEHGTGFQRAGFMSMDLFLNAMLDPFVSGRSGGFGAGLGYAQEPDAHPAAAAFAAAMPVKAPPAPALGFEQRWTVWGAAYGGRNRTDGDPVVAGSADLSASAAGFAGGADYRVSPGSVVGAAVAIGESHWNVAGRGKGRADVAQIGSYFSTRWAGAYVSGAAALGWHRAATDRTLNIAGTDRLEADFNATAFSARFEGGWRHSYGSIGVTPYAAVQWQSLSLPAYAERATTGSNQFALTYAGQTVNDTRSELGLWFDTRRAFDNGRQLTLRARAAWVHDFNPGSRIQAAFQTLPGAGFTVDGAAAPRDAALVSAVSELRLRNGVTLIGKFDGEFSGRSHTVSGTGTARYAW